MRIAIVAANTLEFDSRLRRTATTLAGAGHEVTLIGFAGPGLAARESLPGQPGVALARIALDRRISAVFRPLPAPARAALARLLGIDPEAVVLPPSAPRGWRRGPALVRRIVEVLAVLRRTDRWTRLVIEAAPGTEVYHGQALIALPVVRAAARRTHGRFVHDIADIHTEAARLARMPGWFRRLVQGREAGWLRDASGLLTASEGMAEEAVRHFRVAKPTVILNCPPAWQPDAILPEVEDRIRAAAHLPSGRAVILYQGGFSIDRGLEELLAALDAAALRDRDVAVVLLGYGRLRDWLLEQAAGRPGRVAVLDAVPPDELLAWTASADIGYVGVPPRTLNHRITLATKLFEYLMAGLPVVVATGTEHCRLVEAEGVGTCVDVDRPAEIAKGLAALLDMEPGERDRLRRRARETALGRYSWEVQQHALTDLYASLAAGVAGAAGVDGVAGVAGPAAVAGPASGAGAPLASAVESGSLRGPGTSRTPRIALLTNNPFVTDYRVWKLARSLTDAGYEVVVVARPGKGLPDRARQDGFEVIRVAQPAPSWLPAPRLPGDRQSQGRLAGVLRETAGRFAQAARFLWLARAWAARIEEAVPKADVWLSEALISLPVALELRRRRGGIVIHDAPDLDVESAGFARLPGIWRRLLHGRERAWVRACDGLVTASRPYAEVLERTTGRRPIVVMNGPLVATSPATRDRRLHERIGLRPDIPLVLTFGQIVAGRGIEALIDAMDRVPGANLAVVGHGSLVDAMRARATAGRSADRIHFLPGIAPAEIPGITAAADVSAMPIEPITLNHRLTVPTKLLDAMAVGTPVVATDLEGMGEIVRASGCGVVCRPADPADLARALHEILDATPEQRAAYGEAGRRAVREVYGWERQVTGLLDLLRALGVPASPASKT